MSDAPERLLAATRDAMAHMTIWHGQEVYEAATLDAFHEAVTPALVEALWRATASPTEQSALPRETAIPPTKEALTGQGVEGVAKLRQIAADAERGEFDCLQLPEKLTAALDIADAVLAERGELLEALMPFGRMADPTVEDFDRARAAISKATISSVAGREVAAPPGVKSDSKGGH